MVSGNRLRFPLYFLGLILAAIFFCRYIEDDSLFLHLAVGRHRAALSFSPDPLSYVSHGSFDPFWGSEALLYLFCQLAGEEFLWVLPGLLYTGMLACYLYASRASLTESPTWLVVFLLATFPFHRYLSLEYMGHLWALLLIWSLKRKTSWPAIIALQLLWINTHPSFWLGPVTGFLLLRAKKKGLLLLSLLPLCLISPFHYHSALSPLYWLAMNREGTSLWPGFWMVWTVAMWVSWKGRKEAPLAEHLVLPLWAAIALLHPTWSIPTALWSIMVICERVREHFMSSKTATSLTCCAALAIAVASIGGLDQRWCGKWGIGISEETCPIEAAKFLNEISFPVHIIHDETHAGYLAWKIAHKIFLDERPFIHSRLLREDLRTGAFDKLVQPYDINVAVVRHTPSHLTWFLSHRIWHPVYCDHLVAIFVRSDAQSRPFIEAHLLRDDPAQPTVPLPSNPQAYLARARAYVEMKFPALALKDIQQASYYRPEEASPFIELCLKINTTDSLMEALRWCDEGHLPYYQSQVALALAKNLELKGSFLEARQYLLRAWNAHPDVATASHIIELCLKTGTPEALQEAELWCATASLPRSTVLMYRAEIANREGNTQKAVSHLRSLLEEFPDHKEAREYLRQIEEQLEGETIAEILTTATRLKQEGKYDKALEILQQLVAENGNLPEAHLEMGKLQMEIKNYSQALSHFDEILRVAPGDIIAKCGKATALAYMGQWETSLDILDSIGKEYEDRYDVRTARHRVNEIAISYLQSRSEEFPKRPSLIMRLARLMAEEEKFTEAIEVMQKWNDDVPTQNRPEYHLLLSDLYFESGKHLINEDKVEQGIEWLYASTALNPAHLDAHILLGAIALKMRQWEKAQAHFQESRRIAPQDARAQQGLAMIALGRGLSSQAKGDYEKAIEDYVNYAISTPDPEERKRMEAIIENLRKNRPFLEEKRDRDHAEKLFTVAVKAMSERKWDLAGQLFENVLRLNPDFPDARSYFHYAQGKKAMDQNQWDRAGREFENALSLKPDFVEARCNLGVSYLKEGRTGLAQDAFSSVLKARPDFPNIHLLMGDSYYLGGIYRSARHHFQRHIETPKGQLIELARIRFLFCYLQLKLEEIEAGF